MKQKPGRGQGGTRVHDNPLFSAWPEVWSHRRCLLVADAAAVPAAEHAHGCFGIRGRATGFKCVHGAVRDAGGHPCNRRSTAAAGCSTATAVWHAAAAVGYAALPAAAGHAAWRTRASPWVAVATAWRATARNAGHSCSCPRADASGARILHAALHAPAALHFNNYRRKSFDLLVHEVYSFYQGIASCKLHGTSLGACLTCKLGLCGSPINGCLRARADVTCSKLVQPLVRNAVLPAVSSGHIAGAGLSSSRDGLISSAAGLSFGETYILRVILPKLSRYFLLNNQLYDFFWSSGLVAGAGLST